MPSTPHTFLTIADMRSSLGGRLCALLGLVQGSVVDDSEALIAAISATNALINTYLRARYTDPMATIDPSLIDAAVRIAVWKIASVADKQQLRETDRDNYEDAVKYLEELRDGTMTLVFEPVNRTEMLGPSRAVEVGASACGAIQNKRFFSDF